MGKDGWRAIGAPQDLRKGNFSWVHGWGGRKLKRKGEEEKEEVETRGWHRIRPSLDRSPT